MTSLGTSNYLRSTQNLQGTSPALASADNVTRTSRNNLALEVHRSEVLQMR